MNETVCVPDTQKPGRIFTVGHSDHTVEELLALLRQHGIGWIVDVRSQPYSQWVPQFNRENLLRALAEAGVRYIFLGDALGGRPSDRSLYDPGEESPNYERLAASAGYLDGIARLLELVSAPATQEQTHIAVCPAEADRSAEQRVAILCSEGDFRKCHRGKLITPSLLQRGVQVIHIEPNGALVDAELEPRQLTFF